MTSGHSRLAAVTAAMAVVAAGLAVAWAVRDRGRPVEVVLYGDSLAAQSSSFFQAAVTAHHRVVVRQHVFGGTAICDWLGDMRRTVAQSPRPKAVVLEFSGDDLTPCMRDPATGQPLRRPALVARYQADAEEATRIFGNGPVVYWVGPPVDRDLAANAVVTALRAVYQEVPQRFSNARYVDAGAAVLDQGRYTDWLPCLLADRCPSRASDATLVSRAPDGTLLARVRSPDGIHFCPVAAPENGACPVWSSGAFRFGVAMAAPVAALGL